MGTNTPTKLDILPEGQNLCTYYILPFIGINKDTFPGFINSYISFNGKVIVELDQIPELEYWDHPQYVTDFEQDGHLYIVYLLPASYNKELALFLEGRYSEYEKGSKSLIYRQSGLDFNKSVGGTISTHPLLLVLAKHDNLRKLLEDTLEVVLPSNGELWEKPDINKEVMDIDTEPCY